MMDWRISRRAMIAGAAGSLLLPQTSRAQDQDQDDLLAESPLPPLPSDLASHGSDPAYRPTTLNSGVGTRAATSAEEMQAKAIMRVAPINATPIEVARYFHGLGQLPGDPRAPFTREWPIRANPLIVNLFLATHTVPQGDVTHWCAAFVNWCIARANSSDVEAGLSRDAAGQRFSTAALAMSSRSASSGSFRCWTATDTPRPGDLAVFRQRDNMQQCGGSGHVAFFLESLPNGDLRILGGNQILRGTSGAITISRYPRAGGERGRLRFFGFRTSPHLH